MNPSQRLSVINDMRRRFVRRLQGAAAAARGVEGRDLLRRNRTGIAQIVAGLVACAVLAVAVAARPGSPVERKAPSSPLKTGGVDKAQALRLGAFLRRSQLMQRADEASAEAVRREIARLASFFAECKKGARPFAEEVLSLEASFRLAGSAAEYGVNAIHQAFGGAAPQGPDRFDRYVTECFERHVLKPANLERAVDAALNGYAAELARIESRLLVDMRADVDTGEIGVPVKLLPVKTGDIAAASWRLVIDDAVAAVRRDLCVSIGKFSASWVGGDMVEKRITNEDDHALKKIGVNVAASMAIDKVLDEGLARAGYDPAGRIAAEVCLKLDAIHDLVVGGKPTYAAGSRPAPGGSSARDAARKTLAMEIARQMRSHEPGLRSRLLAEHSIRNRERSEALLSGISRPARSAPPMHNATTGAR